MPEKSKSLDLKLSNISLADLLRLKSSVDDEVVHRYDLLGNRIRTALKDKKKYWQREATAPLKEYGKITSDLIKSTGVEDDNIEVACELSDAPLSFSFKVHWEQSDPHQITEFYIKSSVDQKEFLIDVLNGFNGISIQRLMYSNFQRDGYAVSETEYGAGKSFAHKIIGFSGAERYYLLEELTGVIERSPILENPPL